MAVQKEAKDPAAAALLAIEEALNLVKAEHGDGGGLCGGRSGTPSAGCGGSLRCRPGTGPRCTAASCPSAA